MNDVIKPPTKKALQGDMNQICVVWLLNVIIHGLVEKQSLEMPLILSAVGASFG